MATLDEILSKLNKWETNIDKIVQIDNKLDGIEQQFNSLREDISSLNERVKLVEHSQLTNNDEVSRIKSDLNSALSDVNELRQESLSNEFVIYGLPPEVSNIDAKNIVIHFASAAEEIITEEDIQFAFARHIKNKSESIVVGRFKQANTKTSLMKSFAAKKPITVEHVINNLEATSKWRGKELVIRNQLTQLNRKICSEAHKLNNGAFRYIWDSRGKIMLKKTELDRAINIRSMAQLIDVMNNATRTQV